MIGCLPFTCAGTCMGKHTHLRADSHRPLEVSKSDIPYVYPEEPEHGILRICSFWISFGGPVHGETEARSSMGGPR